MRYEHNFTKEFLDYEIKKIEAVERSGLSLAAMMLGYQRATAQMVEDGLMTKQQAEEFTVAAAAFAAVVTHYQEFGTISDLSGVPNPAKVRDLLKGGGGEWLNEPFGDEK